MRYLTIMILLVGIALPQAAAADDLLVSVDLEFVIGPSDVRIISVFEYNSSFSQGYREFMDQNGDGRVSQGESDAFHEFLDINATKEDNSSFTFTLDGIEEYYYRYLYHFGNSVGPVDSSTNLTWNAELRYSFDTTSSNEHTIIWAVVNDTGNGSSNIDQDTDSFSVVPADGWRFKTVNGQNATEHGDGFDFLTFNTTFNRTDGEDLVIVIERIGNTGKDDSTPGFEGLMAITALFIVLLLKRTRLRSRS